MSHAAFALALGCICAMLSAAGEPLIAGAEAFAPKPPEFPQEYLVYFLP